MTRDLAALILVGALLGACHDGHGTRAAASRPRLGDAEFEARLTLGRALLDAGRPAEAEGLFETLARDDGDSLRARIWVLRSWMEQGRSNDTLDALDALDRTGQSGPEMGYLYGMAFERRAEGYVALGVRDSSVEMNFLDAADYLEKAVAAEPVRFADAYLPLAHAAWAVNRLDSALQAANRAVEVAPDAPGAWFERGRIALARFVERQSDAAPESGESSDWTVACDSFRRALERIGHPQDEAQRSLLTEAATQLGNALLWRRQGPEATEAFAQAVAWGPLSFDYAGVLEPLRAAKDPTDERPSGFRAMLEGAHAEEAALTRASARERAQLLWWLGWARFVDADWRASEEALREALALAPGETSNAWFYVGLARQYQKDPEGALAAMHSGWEADPTSMVQVAANAAGSLRAFESLLAWCASQEPPRNMDAAFLAEMLSQALPGEPRHWNNLGLFLRDEGERVEHAAYEAHEDPPEELLTELYNRAFRAYERALELSPDDPQLMNDTALMLQYHLGPDYERAEAMYRRAIAIAEERLAAPDLSEEDRARFETTREDATTNLHRLQHRDEEGSAEEEPAAEGEPRSDAQDPAPDGNGQR